MAGLPMHCGWSDRCNIVQKQKSAPKRGHSFFGGPSSVDPRPIRQSTGLSDAPLSRRTGCSSFLPARPCRAITRSVMQKPTQSVGSEIHGREQRPYTKVEFILYTKKSAPKRGHSFLVGHPLLTRALSDSPLDCRMLRFRGARAVQVLDGLFSKKTAPRIRGGCFLWWAIQDLNPGPSGYEPPALTN